MMASSNGIGPVNTFSLKSSSNRAESDPMLDEIVPVNILPERFKRCTWGKLVDCKFNGPVRVFRERSTSNNDWLEKRVGDGFPLNKLLFMRNVCNAGNRPRKSGMGPVMRFSDTSSDWSCDREE
jgi:hypothetical protein